MDQEIRVILREFGPLNIDEIHAGSGLALRIKFDQVGFGDFAISIVGSLFYSGLVLRR